MSNIIRCSLTGEVVSSYQEYLMTEHWKRKKWALEKQSKRECSICGETANLDVHHLTYKRLGNELMKDLMFLCRHCHYSYHEQGSESLLKLFEVKKQIRKEDMYRLKKNRKTKEKSKNDQIRLSTNIKSVLSSIRKDYPQLKKQAQLHWILKRRNNATRVDDLFIFFSKDETFISIMDENKVILKKYSIQKID